MTFLSHYLMLGPSFPLSLPMCHVLASTPLDLLATVFSTGRREWVGARLCDHFSTLPQTRAWVCTVQSLDIPQKHNAYKCTDNHKYLLNRPGGMNWLHFWASQGVRQSSELLTKLTFSHRVSSSKWLQCPGCCIPDHIYS